MSAAPFSLISMRLPLLQQRRRIARAHVPARAQAQAQNQLKIGSVFLSDFRT
jgi:hypothetical protein